MQEQTQNIIHAAYDVLAKHRPMTLRQVFYRLVAAQVIENTQSRYKSLSRALVRARKEDLIPWGWIEDRLRRPRSVSMWDGLSDFADTAIRAYRREVWGNQIDYLEVWLEKDALSGIFERVLYDYGITLNVGRGYDSWSSICAAAERYADRPDVTILYYGDFDPSGEDMVRSLEERLGFFGCWPIIEKVAVTLAQIEAYDLPPNPAKRTDSRAANFVAQHGDNCVELDALPPEVLAESVRASVEGIMDLDALAETKDVERADLEKLEKLLRAG